MALLPLLSCHVVLAAPRQVQGWQWQRAVLPTTPITEQCVVLDADVYARSAPGLRDLRLLQAGREVAYALEESFDEGSSSAMYGDRSQYTTVLAIPLLSTDGPNQAAGRGVLPRHVPVERMTVVPGRIGNNALEHGVVEAGLRLRLTAAPLVAAASPQTAGNDAEVIEAALTPSDPVLQTAVGANLQDDAAVSVTLQPSPLLPSRVLLQMRQRSLCFLPIASTPLVLRFGNPAARPVHYEYAAHYRPTSTPVMAQLGPVEQNPGYGAEAPRRSAGTRASYNALAGLAAAALLLLVVPVLLLRQP